MSSFVKLTSNVIRPSEAQGGRFYTDDRWVPIGISTRSYIKAEQPTVVQIVN